MLASCNCVMLLAKILELAKPKISHVLSGFLCSQSGSHAVLIRKLKRVQCQLLSTLSICFALLKGLLGTSLFSFQHLCVAFTQSEVKELRIINLDDLSVTLVCLMFAVHNVSVLSEWALLI